MVSSQPLQGSSGPAATPAVQYATPTAPSEVTLPPLAVAPRLTPAFWLKTFVIVGLLGVLFQINLVRLWAKANPFTGVDANWGHAFIIPLIGLYYLYVNREKLLRATLRPLVFERFTRIRLLIAGTALLAGAAGYLIAPAIFDTELTTLARAGALAVGIWGLCILALGWGVGSLVYGLLVFAYGIYPGQNDWLKDFGMVLTIFGTVLLLCGWDVMKVCWFPIAFLVFALPWPTPFYSAVASPLQRLAAEVAVQTLQATGVLALRNGTKIMIEINRGGLIDWRTLNVAEACAGMRSLMTFLSLAAAMAFLSARPLWQKLVITFSAIPIAIFCNVLRVAGQGLLDHYVDTRLSESFAHAFVGLVMLTPAFFLILLVGWILDHIFVDEAEDKKALAAKAKARKIITIPRPAVAGSAVTGDSGAHRSEVQ